MDVGGIFLDRGLYTEELYTHGPLDPSTGMQAGQIKFGTRVVAPESTAPTIIYCAAAKCKGRL